MRDGPALMDAAALDQFLAEADAERARLELELRQAQDRLAATSARRHDDDAQQAELAALTRAAETELARLEDVHRRAIEAIRRAALDEATAVLARAHATETDSTGGPATEIDT